MSATSADTAELPRIAAPVNPGMTGHLGDPLTEGAHELEYEEPEVEHAHSLMTFRVEIARPGPQVAGLQPVAHRFEPGSTPRSQLRLARRRARRERLFYMALGLALLAGVLAVTILTLDMVR